jgi:hypothetical protein
VSNDFLLTFLFVNATSQSSSKKCEIFSYLVIKFTSPEFKNSISFRYVDKSHALAWNVLYKLSNAVKGVDMINPTAAELALINIFIIVLILLEGILKIGSAKSDYANPN